MSAYDVDHQRAVNAANRRRDARIKKAQQKVTLRFQTEINQLRRRVRVLEDWIGSLQEEKAIEEGE